MPRGRRDDVERAIIDVLRAAGAEVLQLEDPDAEGVPDLLVGVLARWTTARGGTVMTGANVLLEVKSGNGKLRSGQRRFADRWPCPVAVVRSPEEALQVLGLKAQRIARAERNIAQTEGQ